MGKTNKRTNNPFDMSEYNDLGVSARKDEVDAATAGHSKGIVPGAFCKVLPDYLANDPLFAVLKHADGAGTKSSLAYAYWRETGDMSVWKGIAQDAIAMNLDDLACAGVSTENIVLTSTIGRNKKLVPGEVIKALMDGTEEVLEQLRGLGINIFHAGGETADVGDLVRTVIVDADVVCRMDRRNIIDNSKIRAGDMIVGLSSFGTASYETAYNSGMGSNGLTLARHKVFLREIGMRYPETFDPALGLFEEGRTGLAYQGAFNLTDPLEGTPLDMGKAVLSPTRLLAPVVSQILQRMKYEIHGLVHCSGGGQTKVLKFLRGGLMVTKNKMFEPPPIFRTIQAATGTAWQEMYETFNMGHRIEVYIPKGEMRALKVIEAAAEFGVEAQIIGYVQPSSGSNCVVVRSPNGEFIYK